MAFPKLWNVGAKVSDLEADVELFRALGATVRLRETLERPGFSVEYAMLDWGGTRLYLTPEPVFERELTRKLGPGLTHIVVEVESVPAAVSTAVEAGAAVRIEPQVVTGGFGEREIAFVETPGEVIIEFIHILRDGLA